MSTTKTVIRIDVTDTAGKVRQLTVKADPNQDFIDSGTTMARAAWASIAAAYQTDEGADAVSGDFYIVATTTDTIATAVTNG